MTNSINSRRRWLRSCCATAAAHWIKRRAGSRPELFREGLLITAGRAARRFGEIVQPWQSADLAALDRAWLQLAEAPHGPAESIIRQAWIERPRGHTKTSDMAVQLAWILLFARHAVTGIAAAADRDQAGLIRLAVADLVRRNPLLLRALDVQRHAVVNVHTGSRLDVISSDVSSSWGALPDFVICDELCHWPQPELWYSLFTSAAKKPHCVLAVLTNAGAGRGWQWQARELARTSAAWHFSTLDGPQAPWITSAALDEQRRALPPAIYARLWENRWQHSDGCFVTLAEAAACRDKSLAAQAGGQPGRWYVAAVDYAEKHDLTVGVVVHVERDSTTVPPWRIVVDRMDVLAPQPEAPTQVAWVEQWMHDVAAGFGHVTFVVDEWQLLGTIQRVQPLYDMQRFAFHGGRGNDALARNLRRLILHRQVAWYPDCGVIAGDGPESRAYGRDDLETELASLLVKETSSGLIRIDHLRDGRHHDDRSFALGAACLHAVESLTGQEWLDIAGPDAAGGFAL